MIKEFSWEENDDYYIDIEEIDFNVKGKPMFTYDIGAILIINDIIYMLGEDDQRYFLKTKITMSELIELEAFLVLLLQVKKEDNLLDFKHDLLINVTERDKYSELIEIKFGKTNWEFDISWLASVSEKISEGVNKLILCSFTEVKLNILKEIFDYPYNIEVEMSNDFLVTIIKFCTMGQLELRTTDLYKLSYNVIFPTYEFNGTIKAHTKSDFKKAVSHLKNLF